MEESERDLIKNSFGTPRNEEIPLSNTIYLDHAGAPLPSKSLLSSVFEELMNLPFGNPHSGGNDSAVSKIISEARRKTLSHFGAKEEDYEVIFTSGATAAIKLVGETFPWSDGSELWFPPNAHTSLLGLRGFTKEGRTRCVGDCGFYPALQQIYFARLADNHQNLCTKCSQLLDCLKMKGETSDRMVHNLIAVPGECNMSGAKLQLLTFANFVESLNAISKVNRFYWLLDAAKLAGSSGVDLSALDHAQRPHFVALSYYKIFGYPTGLGALIVKRDIMHILKKRLVFYYQYDLICIYNPCAATLEEALYWLVQWIEIFKYLNQSPVMNISKMVLQISMELQVQIFVAICSDVTKYLQLQRLDTDSILLTRLEE